MRNLTITYFGIKMQWVSVFFYMCLNLYLYDLSYSMYFSFIQINQLVAINGFS